MGNEKLNEYLKIKPTEPTQDIKKNFNDYQGISNVSYHIEVPQVVIFILKLGA